MCYQDVCPTVRLSVRHTRESRLNMTQTCFQFLDDKFRFLNLGIHPERIRWRQASPIVSENLTNNPRYLENSARQKVSYYYSPIRSRMSAFHWYRNWRPWMTLNGVIVVMLRCFTEFRRLRSIKLTSPWLKLYPCCLQQKCSLKNLVFNCIWFMAIFSKITWPPRQQLVQGKANEASWKNRIHVHSLIT